MRYFVSLVQNEWMKMSNKRSIVYLFLVFTAGIPLIVATLYRLETRGMETASQFCKVVIPSFLTFVSVFMLVFSTRIIVDEYQHGTIRQLLIRPASRTMVLTSKLITLIFILLLISVCVVAFTILFSMMFFTMPTSFPQDVMDKILQSLMFEIPSSLFYIFLTIFSAVLTRSLSSSMVTLFMIFMLQPITGGLFREKAWYKYMIFPNLDWTPYFDTAHFSLPFSGATFGFSVTIVAIYIVVLWGLSLLLFNKRDVQ